MIGKICWVLAAMGSGKTHWTRILNEDTRYSSIRVKGQPFIEPLRANETDNFRTQFSEQNLKELRRANKWEEHNAIWFAQVGTGLRVLSDNKLLPTFMFMHDAHFLLQVPDVIGPNDEVLVMSRSYRERMAAVLDRYPEREDEADARRAVSLAYQNGLSLIKSTLILADRLRSTVRGNGRLRDVHIHVLDPESPFVEVPCEGSRHVPHLRWRANKLFRHVEQLPADKLALMLQRLIGDDHDATPTAEGNQLGTGTVD